MRFFLLILFLYYAVLISAAEIVNGHLYLEIFVYEAAEFSIKSQGGISVREIGSPLSAQISGDIQLSLITSETQTLWGLVNHIEPITPNGNNPDLDATIREKFIWKDGKLAIEYEKWHFEDVYFNSKEEAESYAQKTGYPRKLISPIPMQNARVKITSKSNNSQYFQLPVKITFKEPISINKQENEYEGTFVLKAHRNQLVLIHLQDLENYITGVIPNEIGTTAPMEAFKAQAVAARTHSICKLLYNRHREDMYDLCNAVHCQVYKGNHLRNEQIDKAVYETRNIVMLYDNKIIDAVFHSNCGGKTESNQNTWSGGAIPYLQGVTCNPDSDSLDLSKERDAIRWINTRTTNQYMSNWEKRAESWERKVSKETLGRNAHVQNLKFLDVLERCPSGRIRKLRLTGTNEVIIENEYKIRQLFGGLPSSFFYVDYGRPSMHSVNNLKRYALGSTISIKGKGSGHGVGFCQVGVLNRARDDWTWENILSFYYPGIEFSDKWLDSHHR